MAAWFVHYRQLHEPTPNLDAAEREMIAVSVSMTNGCLYCLVPHGAALREAIGDPMHLNGHHHCIGEGPRKAWPRNVRKLADALGVEPRELMKG